MSLVEWSIGLIIGWWGWRSGWFSLFSVLILVPFLPWSLHAPFVAGLSGVLIVSSSPYSSPFPPLPVFLGLACGVGGVFLLSIFSFSFSSVEGWVPLLAGLFVGILLVFSDRPFFSMMAGLGVVLASGYLVLVHWVVPLGVPSFLAGLSGFRAQADRYSYSSSFASSLRDAWLGVLAGLLPGIGPGLLGLVGSRFSPSLGVANLVFSLGLVGLVGSVRSAPAAVLAFFPSSGWASILFWLILSVLVGGLLSSAFPSSQAGESVLAPVILFLILLLLGGWLSIGCALMGILVSRVLESWGIPPEVGLVFLLPSIVLFYS
jgi:hypothetical protein